MCNRYVALLRGLNVGGKNKIGMKDLAALFVAGKCQEVETYIQSGNVVFSADEKAVASICSKVCTEIRKQLGFETKIVLRSRDELQQIEASNPYEDLEKLHIMFLADQPSAEHVALLDPQRCPPDEFTVSGRDIYLYLPNGMARTKLTNAYFDAKLKTASTVRNWRTVQKLLAMMAG